jgi:hypothetical protein
VDVNTAALDNIIKIYLILVKVSTRGCALIVTLGGLSTKQFLDRFMYQVEMISAGILATKIKAQFHIQPVRLYYPFFQVSGKAEDRCNLFFEGGSCANETLVNCYALL